MSKGTTSKEFPYTASPTDDAACTWCTESTAAYSRLWCPYCLQWYHTQEECTQVGAVGCKECTTGDI